MVPVPLFIHCALEASSEARGLLLTFRSLKISLKQVTKQTQVLTIVSTFRVQWPPLARSFYDIAAMMSLNVSSIFTGAACLEGQQRQSATLEMAFRWCAPVAVFVVTSLAIPLSRVVAAGAKRFLPQRLLARLPVEPGAIAMSPWDVVRVAVFTFVLYYASLLESAAMVLACTLSPNDQMAVAAFPHLDCAASDSEFLSLALASAAFIVIALGGLFSVTAVAANRTLRAYATSNFQDLGWWGFLFDDYRLGKWQWALFMMLKDVALVTIGMTLVRAGVFQLLATASFASAYCLFVLVDKPFVDSSNTIMEVWNGLSLALICFYSAGMGYESSPGLADVTELYADGTEGAAYRARALGMFLVQFMAIVGPVSIISWQLLGASSHWRRLLPPRLRPRTAEQDDEWKKMFLSSPMLKDNGLEFETVLERFDPVDLATFRELMSNSLATVGVIRTSHWSLRHQISTIARTNSRPDGPESCPSVNVSERPTDDSALPSSPPREKPERPDTSEPEQPAEAVEGSRLDFI